MPLATTDLDPRPRFSRARLAAGAFAGAAGGLAFGLLITFQVMRGAPYAPGGMADLIAKLLGTSNDMVVWAAHMAAALVFGLLFATLVAPGRARRVVPLAVAYGAALWVVAAFLGLRLLTGTPLRIDPPAVIELAGHLLFGLVMGAVYVAFFRAEDDLVHDRAARLRLRSTLRRT
jgi:hypothetical protein